MTTDTTEAKPKRRAKKESAPNYIPIAEAAAQINTSTAYIYQLVKEGLVPTFRHRTMIRIERAGFEAFIAANSYGGDVAAGSVLEMP